MKFAGFRQDKRALSDFSEALELWWRQPLGRELFEAESAQLEPFLAKTFGYHFLNLGVSPHVSLEHLSPIKHPMVWSPKLVTDAGDSVLVSQPDALPLPDDSIDVVLLHHLLDFVETPHLVLREAARVTQHKGHLVIVGFNPLSSWGACRFVHSRRRVPWGGRFIGLSRLNDWLTLLDYRIEDVETVMCRPAVNSRSWLEKSRWLESAGMLDRFGAAYIVWAKKEVGCSTPVRKPWQQKQFIPGVVSPASNKGMGRMRLRRPDNKN
ncbi:class I SAM-dependent methyltransferase [Oceanospirillum sp.]|uniref:class I SAM-dependent methyltransferase n=1 Tax=Oceanospirillum sp. TaxID=2021254 RepID=UPI003A955B2B